MRNIGRNRFVKLLNYLEENKFKTWDMYDFNHCAASHLHKVFPKHWKKPVGGVAYLRDNPNLDIFEALVQFFQVGARNDAHFSTSALQIPWKCFHRSVFANTNTKREQIAMMKKFVKIVYDGELRNA